MSHPIYINNAARTLIAEASARLSETQLFGKAATYEIDCSALHRRCEKSMVRTEP
jgi:hypothetical protein